MAETAFKRSERVGQLLQQELGSLIVNEVKDPRIGFVTVTEVRVSNDLRSARAFVSIYGTEEQRSETLEGLQKAAGYLKRELGRRVRLKYTPNLTFLLDTTLDQAERLGDLIDAASRGDIDTPGEQAKQIAPVDTGRDMPIIEPPPKKPKPARADRRGRRHTKQRRTTRRGR